MKSYWFPIGLVTFYLFAYTLLASFGFSYKLIFSMLIISPVLVIWMVIRVLKSPQYSGKTFNDHFYEDNDYRKIPDEADNA
jgi:5-bromo-4-chloroindolyl phosphate hydrolysis protein